MILKATEGKKKNPTAKKRNGTVHQTNLKKAEDFKIFEADVSSWCRKYKFAMKIDEVISYLKEVV